MEEVWKDIKGFEGLYQISNTGKVKSLQYRNQYVTYQREKILKTCISGRGIVCVILRKNNKQYNRSVSKLVFETFTGIDATSRNIIMHKDLDMTNCTLDNLYIMDKRKLVAFLHDTKRYERPLYEYYGEYLPMRDIVKLGGIKIGCHYARKRMRELGWNIYEAVEIPVGIMKGAKNEARI